MNKNHLLTTICIQVTCLCVIIWILTDNSVASVKAHAAYQEPTATPTSLAVAGLPDRATCWPA